MKNNPEEVTGQWKKRDCHLYIPPFQLRHPLLILSHLVLYRFRGASHKKGPCVHDLSKQKRGHRRWAVSQLHTLRMFFTNLSQLTTPSKDTPVVSPSLLALVHIFVGEAHFPLHSSFTALWVHSTLTDDTTREGGEPPLRMIWHKCGDVETMISKHGGNWRSSVLFSPAPPRWLTLSSSFGRANSKSDDLRELVKSLQQSFIDASSWKGGHVFIEPIPCGWV